jgi:diguanylate cyclase (GGDEF)-like protein/PAS domain S-box-containing protein
MNRAPRIPTEIRWIVRLGLLGLAVTVPFSAPDGTGMQWDELVLSAAAAVSAAMIWRHSRRMAATAARPWRVLAFGVALFAFAQLLAGSFPGPAFDGFNVDDVIVFIGASTPLVTCAMLARQVTRTRWTALLVDGAMVTVALLTVTEVLRTPIGTPAGASDDLSTLVLAYGGYAALMLGGAGVLCTVSTASLRRSATTMIIAVGWQTAAAISEAMAILTESPLWMAASDVSVMLSLQTAALAALRAPLTASDRAARATAQVNHAGMLLVVVSILALPAALALAVTGAEPVTPAAQLGMAVVFVLVAARVVLRIREDGRVTEDLVRSDEDFRQLVETSSEGVAIVDADLRLLFASPAARALLGIPHTPDGDLGLLDLIDPDDRPAVRSAVWFGRTDLHFVVTGRDGGRRELEGSTSVGTGSGRRVLHLRDVTTRRRRERELERMAYTDHLTGLPNRALLFQEMSAGPDARPDADSERCLLVVDLDGFKSVNDVAGHEAGDQLLVEVARRLHGVVRDDDLVARLGGDEFAVLVDRPLAEALEVAQRVVDAMAVPHRSGEWAFALGASVGVSVLGSGGGQLAFREADAALRAAKQAGKGCVRTAEAPGSHAGGPDVGAALADGSFELRWSTAVDRDDSVALLSAVPTWRAQDEVPAHELWTAAERQGSTADLVRWMLRTACAEVADLHPPVPAVIPLPSGHWMPEGLAAEVQAALAAAGLPPERLMLALTEESVLTSTPAMYAELNAVQQSGVRLMLDSFGMGHSMFALLARLPLDAARFDLAGLSARGLDRGLKIVAAMARTCADFDMLTVADGVDTEQALEGARRTGVGFAQGRAVPSDLSRDDVRLLLAGASAVAVR